MVDLKTDERRKHYRVTFATQIQIDVDVEEEIIELEGSSKDLSLTGMFAGSKKKFARGTKCIVKVYLTGYIEKKVLIMKGFIARTGDSGMGIKFDSMDVDTYSHLKNIVNYNCCEL